MEMRMLILHQSNRLEHLAEALASLLNAMPLEDVFESETIVIQSQGMRRYINRYLAQKNGIAANIDFSLPARKSTTLVVAAPPIPRMVWCSSMIWMLYMPSAPARQQPGRP